MKDSVAKRNYDYCIETVAFTKSIAEHFLVLAERLARIRQEELYKPGWESWGDYLEEMRMPESVASRLVNIYLKFVVQYQVPRAKLLCLGGWSDLSDILPYANSKEEAVSLIDELEPLTRQHRRLFLKEKKRGRTIESHRHRWTDIHFRQCSECGEREKIYDDK